jgi:hypothetical protein
LMALDQCIDEIKAASGGKLDDAGATRVLGAVMDRALRYEKDGMNRADAALKAAREMGDEERMAAAIQRRNALMSLRARVERRQVIERAPTLFDGFRAVIHGINTPIAGGRMSAAGEWRGLHGKYMMMTADLERAGLLASMRKGLFDRELAREMYALAQPHGEGEKIASVTGHAQAFAAAQILHKFQELARNDVNKAGAWIGAYDGYIARTSHDPDAIRRAGFEEWRQVVMENLDQDRTFEGIEDPEAFLRGVYNALITGTHLTQEGMQGFKDPAFQGPGNLGRRLSQGRELHWRDADAWMNYREMFGESGSLLRTVISGLDRSARWTAIMRRFGTNPRAELEGDLKYFRETQRDTAPEKVNALQDAEKAIWNRFDELDGTANRPVNRLFAKVAGWTRLDQAFAHLGGLALTHLSAGMTRAAEFRHHGIGFLESYGDYLTSFVRGRGFGANQREVAAELGAGFDGVLGDIRAPFDPDDSVAGTASFISNQYFKATGITYLYNAMKTGANFMLSHNLGRQIAQSFGELKPELTNKLSGYGIDADRWDMLRTAPDHATANGKTYLTPRAARNVDGAAIEKWLRDHAVLMGDSSQPTIDREIDRFREQLAMSLHAYFADTADRALITPGIEEKAILRRGTRPGTPEGEAARFFAQFKIWPTALVTQALGREFYAGGAGAFRSRPMLSAVAGIAHMAVAGMVFGYLRDAVNDLAGGRNPPDPNAPETWLAGLAHGGALGIFGDFLFGESGRSSGGLPSAVAGPVLGTSAYVIYDIWNRLKEQAEGKRADVGPELVRLINNAVPFTNLFYLRGLWNYAVVYQIQEAMNPGYLRRMEQRARHDRGTTYWLSPSQTAR